MRVSGHPVTVTIGCFASLCTDRLGDILIGLSHHHSAASVGVRDMALGALMPALTEGDIDLAVTPGDVPASLSSKPLWTDCVRLAVPSGHALARHGIARPEDFHKLVFLVPGRDRGGELHRFLVARVRTPGQMLTTVMHDGDLDHILNQVALGHGVALVTNGGDRGLPGVDTIAIDAPSACFTVRACWRAGMDWGLAL